MKKLLLILMTLLLAASYQWANAQNQIDIGIYATTCSDFEVRLKSDADITGTNMTNVQFAVKYPASITFADFVYPFAGMALQYTTTVGADKYTVFVGINVPINDWVSGTEYTIAGFSMDHATASSALFEIAEDSWTTANNAMYYAELLGLDATGMIYADATVSLLVHNTNLGLYYCKIQQAVNDAGSGNVIEVDAGIFTEQVTINIPLSLIGAGETNTIIQAPASGRVTITEGTIPWDYVIAADGNGTPIAVKIQGFTIDGNSQNATPVQNFTGVFLRDVSDGLYACTVNNFGSYFGGWSGALGTWNGNNAVTIYNNSQLTINDCDIDDYTVSGISCKGSNLNATITNNDLDGTDSEYAGLFLRDGTATISGNNIHGHDGVAENMGIYLYDAASGVTIDNSVAANTIDDNYIGIWLNGTSSAVISGNTFTDNSHRSIIINQDSHNNTVKSNTITMTGPSVLDAIYIGSGSGGNVIGGITPADGNNITIPSNTTIQPHLPYVILIATGGAHNATVQNNTITNGARGLQIDGGNSGTYTVSDNVFSTDLTNSINMHYAIGVNSGNVVVNDNTMTDTQRPFECFGAGTITFTGNTLSGTNFFGVNLGSYAGNPVVTENAFLGFGGNGQVLWNQGAGVVNGTCNYWDTTDPYAIENAVEGNVQFLPFWTAIGGPCDGLGPVIVYEGSTATVRSSHMKIQDGVYGALAGDLITVAAGTFPENVDINKANLTVVNASSPVIIDGSGSGTVVSISANSVIFQGFTVQNSGSTASDLGIQLYAVGGCTVSGNTVINNTSGIGVIYASGNFITSNVIHTNTYYGIALAAGTGNTLNLNNISANGWDAIALDNGAAAGGNINDGSTGNLIKGNTLSSIRDGIFLGENCDDNQVTDVNQINATNIGISFWRSGGHTVTENNITSSGTGIRFLGSSDNTITGNTITGNNIGLQIDASWQVSVWYPSLDNDIFDNTISGNTSYGVDATDNQNGLVDISYNWWGDPSGPYNDPDNLCGLGNEVDGNLIFMPWYFDAAMTTLNGNPDLVLSAIDDISTLTNTPVIVSETVTYPDLTGYDPAILTDAIISTTTSFPTGAQVFQIIYTDGANPPNVIPISPAFDLEGLSQVYLSDILGTLATPLVGHSGKTINWKFYIEGATNPVTLDISIQSVSYLIKTECNSELGLAEDFTVTFADMDVFGMGATTNPAQIMCDQVVFTFNEDYPAVINVDTDVLSDALLTVTSADPIPAGTTIAWDVFGGGSYLVSSPLSSIYVHELFGATQGNPLVWENEAVRTWTFTLTGSDLYQHDYDIRIDGFAQLDGVEYVYATTNQYIKGLPTVSISAIDDISTITSTPVIIAQSVTYPATISALNSVLTDAVLSSSVAFPSGAVVETVTYDDGINNFTWPVNFSGFDGVETDFYLSEILGAPAYPLNGHAGLTVQWTFTVSGFVAPYSGTVTITPLAYIDKLVCESQIGTSESFVLTFADAGLVITETDIEVCDPNPLMFSADISYPAIQNLDLAVKADCQLTSDVDFPAGTTIQWSYNSSPMQTYVLGSASNSLLLSVITGVSPVPSLQGHTGTDYWDFEITNAGAPSVHNLTIEPVAVLGSTLYPYENGSIELIVHDLPAAPTAGNVTVVYDGLLHTGSATAPGDASVVWYDAPTGGNVSVAPSGINVGVYTAWAESEDDLTGCVSATRTEVTVTITPVTFGLRVWLQGPFDGGTGLMKTELNAELPNGQPFNDSPWNYTGTETLPSPLSGDVVDWVLVELRSDVNTMIGRSAGLVYSDGTVSVSIDDINFPGVVAGSNYFIVVWHRNHMPVMSATAQTAPVAGYDFSSLSNCYDDGAIELKDGLTPLGIYAMISGDVTKNGMLKYSGPGNDRGPIIARIVAETGFNDINGYTGSGYWQEDANLDNIVLYIGNYLGKANDRANIIVNLNEMTGNTYLNSTYTSVVPGSYTGSKSQSQNDGPFDVAISETGEMVSVQIITSETIEEGLVDNIQFTLAWKAGDVEIAEMIQSFSSDFMLVPQGEPMEIEGFVYQVFASVTPTALAPLMTKDNSVDVITFENSTGFPISDRLWIAENDVSEMFNGEYYVSVWGTDNTGMIHTGTMVGTGDMSGDNVIALYPNPVSNGSLYIQINTSVTENLNMVIYDLHGKKMTEQKFEGINGNNRQLIDVSGFSTGIYLINIVGENVLYQDRFIVK